MSTVESKNRSGSLRPTPNAAINQARNSNARHRIASPQCNSRVAHERDRRMFAGQIFLLICGAALACGFVYAAGQKFAAVRYGYRHEALRQEQERLLSEQRRLMLELDRTASPSRLEKVAKNAGLDAVSAAQIHAPKVNAAQTIKASGTKLRDAVKVNIAAKSNDVVKSNDIAKANKPSSVIASRR